MKKNNSLVYWGLPNCGVLLGVILLACFLLVAFSIKSYGASYDETSDYSYASSNLQVYMNLAYDRPYTELIQAFDLRYKGPAYWFAGEILSDSLTRIFPSLDIYDAWHVVNFATFLLGVWFLYCLARRFAAPQAALLGALLFLTQPLLWGHGVMNPKDPPFMTFFLGAILAGLKMIETLMRPAPARRTWASPWQGRKRVWIGLGLTVIVLALLDRVFGHFISQPLVTTVVSAAYNPASSGWLHTLFDRFASNAGIMPVSDYIEKVMLNVNLLEAALLVLAAGSGLALWWVRAGARGRWIFLAGVIAGMTISIRVLGPAAMGLVGLYGLTRLKWQSWKPMLIYVGVSLLVAYIFWPYLWNDPVGHFLESLKVMSNFPWLGTVRFEGGDYLPTELPWYYLPKLLVIQFTLPLLILAITGLVILAWRAARRRTDWKLAMIPVLWLLLPLAGVLAAHPEMYDNFRQFLFILPPLFLFAAVAVEWIWHWLKSGLGRGALIALILLPGIAAGIWLHPYEYVYYNGLVGWTGQVERTYEADYWMTSMCESGRTISAAAPEDAKIGLTDETARILFQRCTDKPYSIFVDRSENSPISPDFSIVSTRYDDDQDYFRNIPIVKTIGRGNTGFSVIRKAP